MKEPPEEPPLIRCGSRTPSIPIWSQTPSPSASEIVYPNSDRNSIKSPAPTAPSPSRSESTSQATTSGIQPPNSLSQRFRPSPLESEAKGGNPHPAFFIKSKAPLSMRQWGLFFSQCLLECLRVHTFMNRQMCLPSSGALRGVPGACTFGVDHLLHHETHLLHPGCAFGLMPCMGSRTRFPNLD